MANLRDPAAGQLSNDHIKLSVSELERSIEWYSAVMGARRLTELDHHCPDGNLPLAGQWHRRELLAPYD
ncbi:MAG TPA: VOC family protein [Pseudonocardiaceae bacterium]|nr:VOC family protein [Pseudonocardiaceae bacterium]